MIFTAGVIALAIIAAMYWMPPMARLVETPCSVEQLTQQIGETSPSKTLVFHQKTKPTKTP